MNFIDISELGVTTDLEVLRRDTQRSSFFLYQHKGVFFADNNRIGNYDQDEAAAKFIKVLTKAKDNNIALVLSPEYSCPKSVIDQIIVNENLQPGQNKIWALGGESLNKEELNNLRGRDIENIYIHFEDCYSNSDKNYVDPLYYIFQGQHNEINKLIILVQFKSRHMGGLRSSQLEANNLIEGENVYILKNNQNSVRLISFICSQAMNFDASYDQLLIDNHSWTDSPFLFLSLQFNPNPSHDNFIAFKKHVLTGEKRELITLNWGKGTKFLNGTCLYQDNSTPRSGIFFKTTDTELDYDPTKILNHHNKGFYFLQILRDKRVYFLNGVIDLFRIDNKSVSIVEAEEVQRRREGPSVSNIYVFEENLNLEEIEIITDNHIQFLKDNAITNTYLLNNEESIIDKERLLNISTGKVKGKEKNKWADVIHLDSFKLNESTESNNRLTYIEDTYSSSQDVRSRNCSFLFELDVNIIPNSAIYPHNIKHLVAHNISLAFAQNADKFDYRYNLVDSDGDIAKATICYVGSAVPIEIVNKAYDELQNLFDEDSPGKDTVVVFYKTGNNILNKSNPNAGSITDIPNNNSSIL